MMMPSARIAGGDQMMLRLPVDASDMIVLPLAGRDCPARSIVRIAPMNRAFMAMN